MSSHVFLYPLTIPTEDSSLSPWIASSPLVGRSPLEPLHVLCFNADMNSPDPESRDREAPVICISCRSRLGAPLHLIKCQKLTGVHVEVRGDDGEVHVSNGWAVAEEGGVIHVKDLAEGLTYACPPEMVHTTEN